MDSPICFVVTIDQTPVDFKNPLTVRYNPRLHQNRILLIDDRKEIDIATASLLRNKMSAPISQVLSIAPILLLTEKTAFVTIKNRLYLDTKTRYIEVKHHHIRRLRCTEVLQLDQLHRNNQVVEI